VVKHETSIYLPASRPSFCKLAANEKEFKVPTTAKTSSKRSVGPSGSLIDWQKNARGGLARRELVLTGTLTRGGNDIHTSLSRMGCADGRRPDLRCPTYIFKILPKLLLIRSEFAVFRGSLLPTYA
jgi:hypothetical protein